MNIKISRLASAMTLGFLTFLIPLPAYSASLIDEPTSTAQFQPLDENSTGLGSIFNGLGLTDSSRELIDDIVQDILENVVGIIIPEDRPLMPEDFSTIKSALILVACADGQCQKPFSVSNNGTSVSIARTKVSKTGKYGSMASIDGELKQTLFNNPACVGNLRREGRNAIECSMTANAANRPGEIFVANTSALAFGLLYDGEDAILLRAGKEDEGEIYREVPEPTSTLSLLTLGTLGAVGLLRRKRKA